MIVHRQHQQSKNHPLNYLKKSTDSLPRIGNHQTSFKTGETGMNTNTNTNNKEGRKSSMELMHLGVYEMTFNIKMGKH